MTWKEAVDYVCPASWGEGSLATLASEARNALERGRPLFRRAVGQPPRRTDAPRLGAILACLGTGLDLQAASVARGSSGGRELLLGDGLVTRALELAGSFGADTLDAIVALAHRVLGEEAPLRALEELLDQRGIDPLLTYPSATTDGGSA
ncbi:MAG: hypothetical protein MUE60_04845 [Candidatus Eisenbacteria bacterium]|jgi:hypothetical protein|nr:hypothetical protein [Candidatus Eisenbacteria bacterium]